MPSGLFYKYLIILQVTKLKKKYEKDNFTSSARYYCWDKDPVKTILSLRRPVKVLHKTSPFCFWTNGSDGIQQKFLTWIMQYKQYCPQIIIGRDVFYCSLKPT